MIQRRCALLFYALVLLLVTVPLLGQTVSGRLVVNGVNLLILLAGVAAIGRSRFSFTLGVLFALPAAAFLVAAFLDGRAIYFALSWAFAAAFYMLVLAQLLRYVFARSVLSAERLYGAAAAYVMLGVLWTYFYSIAQHFSAGAFTAGSGTTALSVPDLMYFSFTVLTTVGFGDITPALPAARTLVTLQQITSSLFIAILIARLAGMSPAEDPIPSRGESP